MTGQSIRIDNIYEVYVTESEGRWRISIHQGDRIHTFETLDASYEVVDLSSLKGEEVNMALSKHEGRS